MKQQLYDLMSQHGDTPRSLAAKANLAVGTIEHILAGRRGKRVSFYVVERIAKVYGVSTDFFSSETPHMETTRP